MVERRDRITLRNLRYNEAWVSRHRTLRNCLAVMNIHKEKNGLFNIYDTGPGISVCKHKSTAYQAYRLDLWKFMSWYRGNTTANGRPFSAVLMSPWQNYNFEQKRCRGAIRSELVAAAHLSTLHYASLQSLDISLILNFWSCPARCFCSKKKRKLVDKVESSRTRQNAEALRAMPTRKRERKIKPSEWCCYVDTVTSCAKSMQPGITY